MGAACAVPERAGNLDELYAVADTALYEAKRAGRDRIEARDYLPSEVS